MREWGAAQSTGVDVPMPELLASGPCIEDWLEPGARMPQHSALRAWQRAVNAWAPSAGYGVPGRPLSNAQNRARIARAWSRDFLIADGRAELADYLDGRGPEPPKEMDWLPLVAPSTEESVSDTRSS